MAEKGLNLDTKTGRIHIKALELLKDNPQGMRWVDLAKQISEYDPSLHPKTINGCIWRLTETFPGKIHKAKPGLFKLIKP